MLVYYDVKVIRRSLRALTSLSKMIDIVVVENPSIYTSAEIYPMAMDLIRSKAINGYCLFDKNISNNAIEVVFDSQAVDLSEYTHVVITDGDVDTSSADWLTESQQILSKHKDVFVCSVRLEESNLPLAAFPESKQWMDGPRTVKEDYIEMPGGMQLAMLRTTDLARFLRFRRWNQKRFIVKNLKQYCESRGKLWVKTKHHTVRHLTWDSYQNANDPYTKLKLSRSFKATWRHFRYCGFTKYTETGMRRYRFLYFTYLWRAVFLVNCLGKATVRTLFPSVEPVLKRSINKFIDCN